MERGWGCFEFPASRVEKVIRGCEMTWPPENVNGDEEEEEEEAGECEEDLEGEDCGEDEHVCAMVTVDALDDWRFFRGSRRISGGVGS